MRIVILGAGQVGGTLAEHLVRENHDVTIVDLDDTRLRSLQSRLDIQTIVGSAAHPDVLIRSGCSNADMLIAVTNSDEVNMIGCFIAYHLFRTPSKVARIRSRDYYHYPELFSETALPIDVKISPEILITKHIEKLIQYPGTTEVLEFAQGLLQLVIVRPQVGGVMVGKNLKQFHHELSNVEMRIVAIYRGNHALELNDNTEILIGDEVFFIASPHHVHHALIALGRFDYPIRRIIIGGGGNIGRRLAETLEDDYRVKIIDHNYKHAEKLANSLNKATVLQGDIGDRELLLNENIEYTDAFIAVTNDDEANIMSCLQAKKLGVKHVMALINRRAYVDLIEDSSIDHALSPQLTTIGSILTQLRHGDMVTVHSLCNGKAEALEVIVHGDEKTSKVVGLTIKDIKLPPSCTLAAIVRDGQIILPNADTMIYSEDHIILIVLDKRYIRQVEQLFQVKLSYFA